MPVPMQTVKFVGRKPSPEKIRIAMMGDHNAEVLHLELPSISETQTAMLFVMLPDVTTGDCILVDEYGNVDFTRTVTQFSGIMIGYVQINVNDSIVWHSDVLYLEIGTLPDIEQNIEAQYPTAFEQVLDSMMKLLTSTQSASNEAAHSATEAMHYADEASVSELASRIAREYAMTADEAMRASQDAAQTSIQAKETVLQEKEEIISQSLEARENALSSLASKQEAVRAELAAQDAKVAAEEARDIAQEYGQMIKIEGSTLIIGGE